MPKYDRSGNNSLQIIIRNVLFNIIQYQTTGKSMMMNGVISPKELIDAFKYRFNFRKLKFNQCIEILINCHC